MSLLEWVFAHPFLSIALVVVAFAVYSSSNPKGDGPEIAPTADEQMSVGNADSGQATAHGDPIVSKQEQPTESGDPLILPTENRPTASKEDISSKPESELEPEFASPSRKSVTLPSLSQDETPAGPAQASSLTAATVGLTGAAGLGAAAVAAVATGPRSVKTDAGNGNMHEVHNPRPETSGLTVKPTSTKSTSPSAPPGTSSSTGMIHQLRLKHGIPLTGPGEVIVLPIPTEHYTLRLLIPAISMAARKGVLQTNYPPEDKEFERQTFYDFPLGERNLHHDSYVDIKIHRSGTFTARMKYCLPIGTFEKADEKMTQTKDWHFIVDTSFHLGNETLTANSLCVQTVLSKLMGKVDTWDEKLGQIRDKGYNMIHFVPLQKRGESDSPFSIYDQLAWDEEVFPNGESDIANLVKKMQDQYGLLSISDIVLNHTANNSAWLSDHLDAGYTAKTAPHLIGPIELENAILEYSQELASQGVELHTAEDIASAVDGLKEHAFQKVKLWEFYVVDVEGLSKTVTQNPFNGRIPKDLPNDLQALAKLVLDKGGINTETLGDRFHRRIDTSLLAEYVAGSSFSPKEILDEINSRFYAEYDADSTKILRQIKDRQSYIRLDANGPNWGPKLTKDHTLVEPYFTRVKARDGSIVEMVNNGWVWAGNPLVDFASPESKAYMLREVIIWGDCVKLRYGTGPEDNPYVWKRMADYCKLLAKHFNGLRIDNAHSTPLHVGQYMLDQARLIRPDVYVVAELFTGSQEMDKLYVEGMGITSLLREAIQPANPKDFSTMVNINGGFPIGSFIAGDVYKNTEIVEVRPRAIHAWLMEATHDNESFAQKRTVEDTLSTAALVATCLVSSGTVMGSDECYPTALNVVSERRPYVFGGGISRAKRVLNDMHIELGKKQALESYTHHEGQYITVHRLNPESGEGYFVIARTKFWADGPQKLKDTFLEKTDVKWHGGWKLVSKSREDRETKEKIVPLDVELEDLEPFYVESNDAVTKIFSPNSEDFPQGSVAVFKTTRSFDPTSIEGLVRTGQQDAVAKLSLLDLNILLYHAEGEERTVTKGAYGTYGIPKWGQLVYAGLQGWETLALPIVINNELGHPLCDNLREGLWAFEHVLGRVRYYVEHKNAENLRPVLEWLIPRIQAVKNVPSFLRPRYFCAIVLGLYQASVHRVVHLMPKHLSYTEFAKRLALSSVQMVAEIPGASLVSDHDTPSMAAGLPHFSEGFMRCWGRDVFLSLGGLLLETGRFDEARLHILSFASTLKHGLIPNLLDAGRNPRYNARDAVWFFAQSIQQYCERTGSHDILGVKVKRRFPLDDRFVEWDSPEAYSYESSIGEILYEILARHAAGIEFREHNAGSQIDSQMKDNGFNQRIYVDWDNGLIFGGNQDNCGTWMDKMGESERAGNRGIPGTPRDGAAIEIIGLLKSCLRWVNHTSEKGAYKFPAKVKNQHGDEIALTHWEKLIQDSFERSFYIPKTPEEDADFDVDSAIVNRRGIYKDLYRSGKPYEDYQLRPNFAVAMVAAPELFTLERGISALDVADRAIRKPYGMATLDPSDLNYRPNYENSIDNDDFATSKGRNYHQGPEWLWCTGMFLQALTIFNARRNADPEDTYSIIRERLQGIGEWLRTSPWTGLTELTNLDGAFCQDSSPTQAWSAARMLELLAEVAKASE